VGAILCRGKRTVSRVLETIGLGQAKQYSNYYRLLNPCRLEWISRSTNFIIDASGIIKSRIRYCNRH
jgi:hypothetical protein